MFGNMKFSGFNMDELSIEIEGNIMEIPIEVIAKMDTSIFRDPLFFIGAAEVMFFSFGVFDESLMTNGTKDKDEGTHENIIYVLTI